MKMTMAALFDENSEWEKNKDIDDIARQAQQRLQKSGMPKRQWSGWEHETCYDLLNEARVCVADKACMPRGLVKLNHPSVVFYNGSYDEKASSLPQEVTLKESLERKCWQTYLEATPSEEVLAAAALMLQPRSVEMDIKRGSQIEILHIYHIMDKKNGDVLGQNTRMNIDKHCQVKVVEHFHCLDECVYLHNGWIHVKEGAHLTKDCLVYPSPSSQLHVGRYHHLERNSQFNQVSMMQDTRYARFYDQVDLAGPNADAQMKSLLLAHAKQHVHHLISMNHLAPKTQSKQLCKGVSRSKGVSNFFGKIYVANAAQQTDASQINHNILLEEGAAAHSKPELEIFADDVKCAHGSTLGQIEKEKLRYLAMRGLDEQAAKKMLIVGFVAEMIASFSDQARCKVAGWVDCFMKLKKVLN